MTLEVLLADNPAGVRVRMSDNRAKINNNFAAHESRLIAVEQGITDASSSVDSVANDVLAVQQSAAQALGAASAAQQSASAAQSTADAATTGLAAANVQISTTALQLTSISQAVQSLTSSVSDINARLANAGISQVVNATSDSSTALDSATAITGNVLSNDSAGGASMSVTSVTYAGVWRTIGTAFTCTYGAMTINANGAWSFAPNSAARALKVGQSGTEVFTYFVNGQTGTATTTLTVVIQGTNSAPTANAASVNTVFNTPISGSLISSVSDVEGDTLSFTGFSIGGTAYSAGATASINTVGTFTLNASGAWTMTPASQFSGAFPNVTFTVTDGAATASGSLVVSVDAASTAVVSDPVTVALTGTRTFNVGPGQTYTELDAVPWSTLTAGDVVNIYYRTTPYVAKFGLSAIGTASNKVIINGVTDASGTRPVITGAGARTASGSMPGTGNVFSTDLSEQALGTIVIKRKPNTSTNPAWILVQNVEVTGAAHGQSFQYADGSTGTYGFAGAIWINPSSDVEVRNCVLRDSSQGLFTNSKAGGDNEQCMRLRIRYNRIYGNGTAGSDTEHGCYVQGYNTILEGNFVGNNVSGSNGASIKTRGGNEVIRYNFVVGDTRMLDLVQADHYNDGMVLMTDYAKTYVYGNSFINDSTSAYRAFHFGGDNEGEQDPSGSTAGSAPANYRKNLYFWNNSFYCNRSVGAQMFLFSLSWPDVTCDAWNNVFQFAGTTSTVCLLQDAGVLNLRGANLLRVATTTADRSPYTQSIFATVNRVGSLLSSDPGFVSAGYYDLTPDVGSPLIDSATALPSGVPAGIATSFPLAFSPRWKSNGLIARSVIGTLDLGAIERDPSAPPSSAPQAAVLPSIAQDGYVSATLTCTDGVWLFSPTTISKQWQHFDTSSSMWVDIAGKTGDSIVLGSSELGSVRCKVSRNNATGTGTSYSNAVAVTLVGPVPIVQSAFGYDNYPVNNGGAAATFSSAPTVGNTLAAFFSGASSTGTANVTDNYGNTWSKRRSILTGSGKYLELYTCVVAAGKTGSGFRVFGASSNQWTSSIAIHELGGAYNSSAASAGSTSSEAEVVSITADAANRRLLGAGAAGGALYSHGTYPTFPSKFTVDRGYSDIQGDGIVPTAYVHGVTSSGVNAVSVTSGNDGLAVILAIFE